MHRNITRKNQKESYIYFLGYGGLSDILSELVRCMEYAKKHKRSILFEVYEYSGINLKTVFDFSQFPVRIYTDKKKINSIMDNHLHEPAVDIDLTSKKKCFIENKAVHCKTPNSIPLIFDMSKSYPRDIIPIRACGGGDKNGKEIEFFKHISLKPSVVEIYRNTLKKFNIPEEYVAAHLRATDKKLSYEFNISGIDKSSSNSIRSKGVSAFIEKYAPFPAYIASDNRHLLTNLSKQHSSVIHTDAAFKTTKTDNNIKQRGLHQNGTKEHLIDAVVELMILARAKVLMTSVGGYSHMARELWKNKDIVSHMLRE